MSKNIISTKNSMLFGERYEIIDSGFNTGDFNMNFDLERTYTVAKGKALPMFRFYGWDPWTVSLGANQNADEINSIECKNRGYGIVRRPTGGRAVFHANELTYSVVLNLPENMSVSDAYREIHIILLEGLLKFGCQLINFEKSQPDFRNFYKDKSLSVSCFASSARYELEYEGRKLVGSAQKLYGRTLLQHGSILIGPGHEQIAYLSANKEDADKLLNFTLSHSATIEEILNRNVKFDEIKECMISIL